MKVLYTALLALLLFPSCRRQSGDIDSFLHNAESLMNEHPEDALSIIRHIDRRKIYSSASEARYALLYSQALDKNYFRHRRLLSVGIDQQCRRKFVL